MFQSDIRNNTEEKIWRYFDINKLDAHFSSDWPRLDGCVVKFSFRFQITFKYTMEIHKSYIRFDFWVLFVISLKMSCCWVHDAWSLVFSTWKLCKQVCEPFSSPSMFSLAKEKKVAEVRYPTSNMENYRDSVTLFKCWQLKTWQTKNLFAFRQQKRPILTGRGCVSHRTKEMTWHHVL